MKPRCLNHPDRVARNVCHRCGRHFCSECLTEGASFYYCRNPLCQQAREKELLPAVVNCPHCQSELKLSEVERVAWKFECPSCEKMVDMRPATQPAREEEDDDDDEEAVVVIGVCANHTDVSAAAACHSCHKLFCAECLNAGVEFLYCQHASCQEARAADILPLNVTCPHCEAGLELEDNERSSGQFVCGACEESVDMRSELVIAHDLGQTIRVCVNHPDLPAWSTCAICHRPFCEECLVADTEAYYCKDPACQSARKAASP